MLGKELRQNFKPPSFHGAMLGLSGWVVKIVFSKFQTIFLGFKRFFGLYHYLKHGYLVNFVLCINFFFLGDFDQFQYIVAHTFKTEMNHFSTDTRKILRSFPALQASGRPWNEDSQSDTGRPGGTTTRVGALGTRDARLDAKRMGLKRSVARSVGS